MPPVLNGELQTYREDMMDRRADKLCVVLVVSVFAMTFVPSADAAQNDWHLRINGVWADVDVDDSEVSDDGSTVDVGSNSGWGFGLGLERRFSDLIGVEVGVDWSRPETTIDVFHPDVGRIHVSDDLSLWTLRAGLNLHLVSGETFDLYVGPVVAWLRPSRELVFSATYEEQTDELRVKTSSEFGWGATAGFDLAIGEYWTVNASASYLKADLTTTDVETGGQNSSGFDPVTLRLGFGLRF